MPQGSPVIPALRYRDAPAAIDWLVKVLGFERHVVYSGANNTVEHAELRLGSGMVMLGSVRSDGQHAAHMLTPAEADGRVTSSVYLVTGQCAPLWDRAQAAGAEVVMPLQTMSYGGAAFAVRDPEGYLWSFGEYDPWAQKGDGSEATAEAGAPAAATGAQ